MPLHVLVRGIETQCRVALAATPDTPLATTALDALPTMAAILGDPPETPNRREGDPYGAGCQLYQALGGDALRQLLNATDDGVLLLECDEVTSTVPWEYAATSERVFLACDFGLLRLEARKASSHPLIHRRDYWSSVPTR